MVALRLPRLPFNWSEQPKMLERYWDTTLTAVEGLLDDKNGVAFADLPTGTAGDRAFVTDATATTFHSIVAGGGSNFVPVFYDGTNWRIG